MIIEKFTLKSGRLPQTNSNSISATPVTVFVGPNNSGKSKLLKEIFLYCNTGQSQENLILESIEFKSFTNSEAIAKVKELSFPGREEPEANGYITIRLNNGSAGIHWKSLINALENPPSNPAIYCTNFLSNYAKLLDGSDRIKLCDNQHAGNLQEQSHSSLAILFKDDAKREEVRRVFKEAFDSYFVIDPTELGMLKIRLSDHPPKSAKMERSLDDEALEFHGKARLISDSSDGVKAFTGIITQLLAGDPKVLLVDEPEAFLHPSLATKLGIEMSRAAGASGKNVFVSTHSPAFVMGCIQSGCPVNIVRLTYRNNAATSRILPSHDLLELMRHPLLRSTGVLSGLFYEYVIVTESDADRAFYQEINERLLQFKPEWGINNCLFINAQNKQTVQTIIKPLRELGIPAAAIVDIDVLKDGGKNWTNLLKCSYIPELSHDALANSRNAIKSALISTQLNMKTDGGISILEPQEREAAENLLEQLNQYGMFTVPHGELESWLKQQGVTGHGPSWLVAMFESMGEDPALPDYVKPSTDDVWAFMGEIKKWFLNPHRKGIPS